MPKIKRNGRTRSVPREMGQTGKKRRGEEKDEIWEVRWQRSRRGGEEGGEGKRVATKGRGRGKWEKGKSGRVLGGMHRTAASRHETKPPLWRLTITALRVRTWPGKEK